MTYWPKYALHLKLLFSITRQRDVFVVKAKNIGFAQLYCGREKRQQGLLSAVNPKRFLVLMQTFLGGLLLQDGWILVCDDTVHSFQIKG